MSIRITDLRQPVADACTRMLAEAIKSDLKLRVVQTLRTQEEQAALYAKGRTRPGLPCRHWNGLRPVGKCKQHPLGLVVTYERAGASAHNFGLAFDVCFETPDGHLSWDGPWEVVGKIGEGLGLEWGGNWPHLVDRPHFQMKDWRLYRWTKET